MATEESKSSHAKKNSIGQLTERIAEQSVKDQPNGILETTSQSEEKPGKPSKQAKQGKQGGEKSLKQAQQGEAKSGKKAKAETGDKKPKKKIEGAALIGIDVAKDANFPDWYQQVEACCTVNISQYLIHYQGAHQGRLSGLLRCFWMLYSKACCVLHMGGNTSLL